MNHSHCKQENHLHIKNRINLLSIILITTIWISGSLLTVKATAQQVTPTPGVEFIQMQAWSAFEGYFKYGEWLPIYVRLENNGPDQQVEVQVQIEIGGDRLNYIVPISLPHNSRKQVGLYVTPNNYTREIKVELVSENNILAQRFVTVQPQPNVSFIAGLVTPERGPLALINTIKFPGQERPVELVNLPLKEIPERYEGLRSLDLIVINNTDTSSLTPNQIFALESWVLQGGRLVIGGGASANQNISGFQQSFLPLEIDRQVTLMDLSGLVDFVQQTNDDYPLRIPGPFSATTILTHDATFLVYQSQTPIVSEWTIGNGYVNYIALDLASSPFDAWNGAGPFWESLITPGSHYPEWRPPDISRRQEIASNMPNILSNLPLLDLPSASGLALLLGFFILIIGPLNYLVLRWKNCLHWAWFTIPTITLFFSVAAFGLGYTLHGTDVFINKITIIKTKPDGLATADSYIGLFSPSRRDYDIKVAGGGLLSTLYPIYDPWGGGNSGFGSGNVDLIQSEPAMVRGLTVDQWSMGSFMYEGIRFDLGSFSAKLKLDGDQIVGSVHNSSKYDLHNAAIVLGNRAHKLGDLSIDQSTDLKMDISTISPPVNFSPVSYQLIGDTISPREGNSTRQLEVQRLLLDSIFDRHLLYNSNANASNGRPQQDLNTPILLGWLDQAPPDISVNGIEIGQQTTALVLVPLSYDLPKSGNLRLPPGLIPGMIVQTPPDGGPCGIPGSTAVYLTRGTAVIEFYLPRILTDLQVNNLLLSIFTDDTFLEPDVLIYDWHISRERPLDRVSQGETLITQASNLVSPEGKVQLRLENHKGSGNCYYFALGLEGHW